MLAPLAHLFPLPEIVPRGGVYASLVRAIVGQQLSGRAASTIHGRFLDLFPTEYPDPELLPDFDDAALRAAGLSRAKVAYIRATAAYFLDNRLLNHDWSADADEEIITRLTAIHGVGRWTVEMLLIFTLHRPDLLPLNDLVVRRQLVERLELTELKPRAQTQAILERAEAWRPHRTTVARLMWAVQNTVVG
ncbi:MAG: DNA-3-methyladenine glycosylase 2 family protein [Saprospiraceae bacterium]